MNWFAFGAVAVVAWVLQTTVVPRVSIGGMDADFLLAIAVFFGLYAKRREAVVAGWFIGFGADLMSLERLGLFSLLYCLAALAANSVREVVFLKRTSTHFFVTLCAAVAVNGALVVYRVTTYPAAYGGISFALWTALLSSTYTAAWAVLLDGVLACGVILFGLHTSRYAHSRAAVGRAYV